MPGASTWPWNWKGAPWPPTPGASGWRATRWPLPRARPTSPTPWACGPAGMLRQPCATPPRCCRRTERCRTASPSAGAARSLTWKAAPEKPLPTAGESSAPPPFPPAGTPCCWKSTPPPTCCGAFSPCSAAKAPRRACPCWQARRARSLPRPACPSRTTRCWNAIPGPLTTRACPRCAPPLWNRACCAPCSTT